MPILASINLNKRMKSQTSRARLGRWLELNRVQFLFAQEPWRSRTGLDANFIGWVPVGGNEKVFAWIDSRLELPDHKLIEIFWQRIELGYLVIYNVYLDAYHQTTRASQLRQIRQGVIDEKDRPVLIVGDFNLAPNPIDGLFGAQESIFNSEVDREPFRQLLESGHLIDLGYSKEQPLWTVERELQGSKVQFRCDLALASDYMVHELKLHYDSSIRSGEEAFTDHSALLIDIPVNIRETEHQLEIFHRGSLSSASNGGFKFKPEMTAIHRKEPSPIARKLLATFHNNPTVRSILDYGCGYGEDVRFYQRMGLEADGYDPSPPFGWSKKPTRKFDIVTVIFVLNVLPNPWERLKVLWDAAQYLSRQGLMVVTTRSDSEIQQEAKKKGWSTFNDGYWSHEGKGTFQRGLSQEEILILAKRVGLALSSDNQRLGSFPATTCVVLQRS